MPVLTFNYPKGLTVYKYGLGYLQLASRVIKQIAGNNYFATYSPLSGHEKTRQTRNDLKICNFKKGIGIKSEKSIQTS